MPANTQPSSLPNPSPPLLPDEYLVWRPTQGGGGPLPDPLPDSSVQAIHDKMASPKLSAVIDMIIAKMKDPRETRIREACEEIWGSLDPLTHLDPRPQIVLGWTESKRPPSLGMVDPEYPEDICVAYHMVKTLEDKEDESDGDILFRFLTMSTLLHELVHWCRRRGNPGASTPNREEGGKRAEMIVFRGEVKFIGEARGDPHSLATEDINRSLLLTQATAVGFRGKDGIVRVQSRERLMGYMQDPITDVPERGDGIRRMKRRLQRLADVRDAFKSRPKVERSREEGSSGRGKRRGEGSSSPRKRKRR